MSKSKVVPIGRKVEECDPPEGWNIRSPFGFLAFDDTRGGRLARLGDVLLWIEKEKVLPRDRALQVLTDRLPEDAIAWVYGLTDGGYANKLPDGWLDTLAHRMQAPRRRQISPGISGNRIGSDEWYARDDFSSVRSDSRASKTVQASVAPAPDPGLPTLRLLLSCWGPLNQKQGDEPALRTGEQWPVNYLAVPLLKASKWWGYGQVREQQAAPVIEALPAPLQIIRAVPVEDRPISTYADLKKYRKDNPGAPWTDDMKVILAKEKVRRKNKGEAGISKVMASELGVSVQFVDAKVREGNAIDKKRQSEQATTTKHRA